MVLVFQGYKDQLVQQVIWVLQDQQVTQDLKDPPVL